MMTDGGNAGPRGPESAMLDPLSLSTLASIAGFARNDFEAPVMARYPELGSHLERLRNSGTIFAQMTGSGSTIFGVVDSPPSHSKVTTTRTSIDVVQPVRVG